MIAALQLWFAKQALGSARPMIFAGLVLLLLVVAGLGFWRGMAAIERLVATARAEATAARDAHWTAEIAKANAAVAEARAAQATAVAALESHALTEISRLSAQLTELETANAALPGAGACGIDRDRVRLLAR
jgi:hypothetical protein